MPEKRITRVEFPARTFSPEQPPPTKRVAAYARVSTMKDAQENSLQAQQEYFTEYIQRHPGWVFAGMYSDEYNKKTIQINGVSAVNATLILDHSDTEKVYH